jgi:NADH:ubiquinone oxidoreductase subunit D
MLEMGESLHIINIVSNQLLNSSVSINNANTTISQEFFFNKKVKNSYNSMEDLINHFLHWHSGLLVSKDAQISYIESPKGEFGVTLVANNTTKPHKCKVKSPSYYNLQALPQLAKGHYLADIAALIGTIDIVFGEVDR